MTAAEWEAVKGLFSECLSVAPESRASLLAKARVPEAIRIEVARLLENHDRVGDKFLETPDVVRRAFSISNMSAQSDVALTDTSPKEASAPSPTIQGRRVHHYVIQEKIGGGGMGVVYKAVDTKLKRTVALKFLPAALVTDEQYRERFFQEAMAAATLDHPNICTIYEINETEDGQPFIAMAYYEGDTVRQLLRSGELSYEQSLDLAIQLGRALEGAHRQGVVHRDIKPANIMVSQGMVKVLDFGIAKLAEEAGLTRPGDIIGTLHYMSPEQAAGTKVDTRADIWAAGAVLYEMLAGKVPFQGANRHAIIESILKDPVPPLAGGAGNLPREVDWILSKALAKQPADRYSEVAEMIEDLEALRGHRQPVTASASSLVVKKSRELPPDAPAVAVLPFENLSADKDNEYFSDGLSEELINALGQIQGLRVVSRTSAFEFKGKAQDIRKIGDLLNVEAVVEGSVRKAGNRIRITAQLVEVATGYNMWSERYDRELSDVFAVQDEISTSIVQALKITLPMHRYQSADAAHSENLDAYQSYLKGRFYWNKKTPEALEKARAFFETALTEDPHYALAFSGLADYYTLLAGYWLVEPAQVWPKAKADALRAVELNPKLPEAYVALGAVKGFYECDWTGAGRDFRSALDLRPQFAEGHLRYGFYFMATRNLRDALGEVRRALQLDPLSQAANAAEAMVLAYSGQHDAAIQRCREALEMDPNFIELHYVLGIALQSKGLPDEAVAAFENAARVSHRAPLILGWLGGAYASAGRRDDALRIANELMQPGPGGFIVPLPLAVVHAGLGDKDQAFEWLNRAADAHDSLLSYVQVVPTYDSLRDDPRYPQLLNRLGLLTAPGDTTNSSGGAAR